MRARIKAWNTLGLVLFLFVLAASVGVFYVTRTGDGYVDFAINMVFDLIAAVFILIYFAGSARPLVRMVSALDRISEEIGSSAEDQRTLWVRYSKQSTLFDNHRLDERYGAYLRESHRLLKQNSLTADCRIDDYIGEELIYSAVNKPLCDQIGGIMSGLGILFTFIGLVYGLRNFDASTVDVMQTSTQALMAGIKIAFLTSIFGLIYSLLFGLFYKKLLKSSLDVLYDFQDIYTERVRPTNEHAAENALLRLQTEQNAAIAGFGASVGEQVSEAIITLMKPTVDELRDTVAQYVSVAIEDQRAGMEKVVRYFLESMESSLGSVFAQLKSRTEELARWEKDMIDAISSMTAGTAATEAELAKAQSAAAQIAKTMSDYTSSVDALTKAQADVVSDMKKFVADREDSRKQESAFIAALAASAQGAAENTKQSLSVAQTVADIAEKLRSENEYAVRTMTEASADMRVSAQAVQTMSETASADIGAAAARLEDAAGEVSGALSGTVGESLASMDAGIAHLNAAMETLSAATGTAVQTMQALPKSANAAGTEFRTAAKVIDTELKLLLKAVSDTEKILNKFNADLESRIGG